MKRLMTEPLPAVLLAVFLTITGVPGPARADDLGSAIAGGIVGGAIATMMKPSATYATSFRAELTAVEDIRNLQEGLAKLGFDPGPADGVVGPRTLAAVKAFRASKPQMPKTLPDVPTRADLDFVSGRMNRPVALPMAGVGAAPPVWASGSTRVLPTRLFVSVEDYPPELFRGYGIVVFKSKATSYDIDRHMMLCQAYVSNLLHVDEVEAEPENQYVTVWPIRTSEVAEALNGLYDRMPRAVCERAVADYDTALAQKAIAAARKANFDDQGIGPFLLGWLPGDTYGKPDAFILALDMSRVKDYAQANSLFQEWKLDIETDPEIAGDLPFAEKWRRKIRRWSDQFGPGFFSVIFNG